VAAVTLADRGILVAAATPVGRRILVGAATPVDRRTRVAAATPVDKDIRVAVATPADKHILAGAATLVDGPIQVAAATLVNEPTRVDEATTAGATGIVAVVASASDSTARLTRIAPAIITSRIIAIPTVTTINGAIGVPRPLAATPTPTTGINVARRSTRGSLQLPLNFSRVSPPSQVHRA
jgi:hypothetical protein